MLGQNQARDSLRQLAFWKQSLDLTKIHNEPDMNRITNRFFPHQTGANAIRDPLGGTLIHWAALMGSCASVYNLGITSLSDEPAASQTGFRKLAKYIVKTCSTKVLDLQFDRTSPYVHIEAQLGLWAAVGEQRCLPYSSLYYDGEAPLHIAVAKNDEELVCLLLQRGANSRARAYGSFFAPGGAVLSYYGEFALSFAASGGLVGMCALLMEHDPESVYFCDSFGNTCLHLAVLHRRIDTYEFLVKKAKLNFDEVAEWKGAMGLTPLGLSAVSSKVGASEKIVLDEEEDQGKEFFRMLNTTRSESWDFNDVVAHSYRLAQIDTIGLHIRIENPRIEDSKRQARSVHTASRGKVSAKPTCPRSPAIKSTPPPPHPLFPESTKQIDNVLHTTHAIQVNGDSPASITPVKHHTDLTQLINVSQSKEKNAKAGMVAVFKGSNTGAFTGFVPIVSLILQYELHYLADHKMVVGMLETKWRVVRYFFYLSVLWHFSYLGVLTAFLMQSHPNGGAFVHETPMASICFVMTVIDIIPNLYDIVVGVAHCMDVLEMRKRHVTRSDKPEQMQDETWRIYHSLESGTVASVSQSRRHSSNLFFILSSFPISGFELIAWLGYAAYAAFLVLDEPVDDTTDPSNITTTTVPAEPDLPLSLMFLGLSTMCAYLSTLTYSPVHIRTGMFVTMMTRTISRDLVPFVVIFSFILTGASAAVYSMERGAVPFITVVDAIKDSLLPVIETNERLEIYTVHASSEGKIGPDDRLRVVSYIIIAVFTAMSSVLMLNLLIATFTSTYEEVKHIAHKDWLMQWGRDILMVERRLSCLPWMRSKLRVNHGHAHEHVFVSIEKKKPKKKRLNGAPGCAQSVVNSPGAEMLGGGVSFAGLPPLMGLDSYLDSQRDHRPEMAPLHNMQNSLSSTKLEAPQEERNGSGDGTIPQHACWSCGAANAFTECKKGSEEDGETTKKRRKKKDKKAKLKEGSSEVEAEEAGATVGAGRASDTAEKDPHLRCGECAALLAYSTVRYPVKVCHFFFWGGGISNIQGVWMLQRNTILNNTNNFSIFPLLKDVYTRGMM